MPEATESDQIPNGPSSNSHSNTNTNTNSNMLAENFFNAGGAAITLPLPLALPMPLPMAMPMPMPMPVASRKDVDFLVQVSLAFVHSLCQPPEPFLLLLLLACPPAPRPDLPFALVIPVSLIL